MKRIKCLETGKIYNGFKELYHEIGCIYQTARNAFIDGVWVRTNRTYVLVDKAGNRVYDFNVQNAKPIEDLQSGKIYPSLTAYAKANGISVNATVKRCRRGKGIRFFNKPKETEKNNLYGHDGQRGVIDVVSGEVWKSRYRCAKELRCSPHTVERRVQCKKPLKGHFLEYVDVYISEYTEEEKNFLKGLRR